MHERINTLELFDKQNRPFNIFANCTLHLQEQYTHTETDTLNL